MKLKGVWPIRSATSALSAVVLVALFAPGIQAAERYAVVITGASGGQVYAEKYDKWRSSFLLTLKQKLDYPDDHVFVLAETEGRTVGRATPRDPGSRDRPTV